jgi:hypothetical protein
MMTSLLSPTSTSIPLIFTPIPPPHTHTPPHTYARTPIPASTHAHPIPPPHTHTHTLTHSHTRAQHHSLSLSHTPPTHQDRVRELQGAVPGVPARGVGRGDLLRLQRGLVRRSRVGLHSLPGVRLVTDHTGCRHLNCLPDLSRLASRIASADCFSLFPTNHRRLVLSLWRGGYLLILDARIRIHHLALSSLEPCIDCCKITWW